jgi:hypothetical protein
MYCFRYDSDLILISENGFSPNPRFLERSEQAELDHLHTYSDDLFSKVQTAHFQHLLGNDAEKIYGNRTNENLVYWTPKYELPNGECASSTFTRNLHRMLE